ncbi:MAG: PspC domain-containing protein [Ornithinimicrobium sp.]
MSEHQPHADTTAEQTQPSASQAGQTHGSSQQGTGRRSFDRLHDIDMRRTPDGWIGGVAAGLAHRLGVDPLVVRAGFIVLGLIFGLGAALYVLAWVLVPDSTESTHAERGLHGGSTASIVLLVLAALVVLGSVPFFGIGGGDSVGGVLFSLIVLAGLGYAFYRAWRGRSAPGAVRQQVTGAVPTAYSVDLDPTPPHGPPAPPRGRRLSGGGALALLTGGALLVIVGGLTWTGESLGVRGNPLTVSLSVGLAVVGVLLVGLGFVGRRAGWVGFLALITLFATTVTAPLPADVRWDSTTGDVTQAPRTAAALQDVDLGAGQIELDLTDLDPRTLDGDTSRIEVGLGQVVVVIPNDLSVEIASDIGAGEFFVAGDEFDRLGAAAPSPEITITADEGRTRTLAEGTTFSDDGTDIQTRAMVGSGPADLVVDVEVGLGQVRIVTEERD